MVDQLGRAPFGGVIAADTNAIHDLFGEQREPKTHIVRDAFRQGRLLLPPPVLSEVLSDPTLSVGKGARIRAIPLLEILDGYWERAGLLRALVRAQRYKAFLADCLIAQSCIDHDIPLITYDLDFRHFVPAGLKLQ